jgi:outer membrane protein
MKLNFLCKLIIAIVSLSSCYTYAQDSYYVDDNSDSNYGNEGRLTLKLKISSVLSHSKGTGLPETNPTTGAKVNIPYDLVKNGAGAEASTTVFFNEHFASELTLGFHGYKTKQVVLDDVALNYGYNGNAVKNLNIYSMPSALTFQYHVAPFGGFSPCVGVGYSLTYFYTHNKAVRIDHFSGAPVFQVGFDIHGEDNTLITFDVKQYILEKDVTYQSSFLNTTNDLKSKLKLNPLVISAGVGFQF